MFRLLAGTPPDTSQDNNTVNEPPDMRELDFSRFHPLDHYPLGCWRRNKLEPIYGKTWTHVKHAWAYKWKQQLRSATTCQAGIGHRYSAGWYRDGGEWKRMPERCIWCWRRKDRAPASE
jgi:hypothetical protein